MEEGGRGRRLGRKTGSNLRVGFPLPRHLPTARQVTGVLARAAPITISASFSRHRSTALARSGSAVAFAWQASSLAARGCGRALAPPASGAKWEAEGEDE